MKNSPSAKGLAHFLAPTGSGILGYILITGLVWTAHDFAAVRRYLQIPDDFNVGQGILGAMNSVLVHLLGAHVNTLVLGLLWAMVGLVVYLITMEIVQGVGELREGMQARHYVWARDRDRNRLLESWLTRTAVRLAASATMILYLVYAVRYITDWHVGTALPWLQWLDKHQTLASLYFVVISLVVWHGFTLLLRLMTLRARLFG